MLTTDFDYTLPPDRVAQTPIEPRDASKLMVVNRKTKTIQHKYFCDIVDFLSAGDLLVWNNSKVFKARLHGELQLNNAADGIDESFMPTGKMLPKTFVEIFLVRPTENNRVWKVLAKPGKKLRLGMKVVFAPDFVGEVVLKEADGTVLMQFADEDFIVREKANKYGEVPTPPYVRNTEIEKYGNRGLNERYQTVYAKHEGSVAAPTAGFHFTPELIEKLKAKGVEFAEVTLHVGLGTFLPVKSDVVEEHAMHSEWVEVTAKNADLINAAKAEGRRVVAVGTTTVRTLEGVVRQFNNEAIEQFSNESIVRNTEIPKYRNILQAYSGNINIFITPGFKFTIVDALITNFHLPKSTLLMLVSAFAEDNKFVLECYQKAVEEKYRFYSFGDAMFII